MVQNGKSLNKLIFCIDKKCKYVAKNDDFVPINSGIYGHV